MNGTAVGDAELFAEGVTGQRDVTGRDGGLGIAPAHILNPTFVQRDYFQDSKPLAKGGQGLNRGRADVQVCMPVQFLQTIAARQVKRPCLQQALPRFEQERWPIEVGHDAIKSDYNVIPGLTGNL